MDKNKLSTYFDKYMVPSISIILIGICTWLFFTRIDKIEVLTSSLNNSVIKMETLVGEMDKALSSSAMSQASIVEDLTNVKERLAIIETDIEHLESQIR